MVPPWWNRPLSARFTAGRHLTEHGPIDLFQDAARAGRGNRHVAGLYRYGRPLPTRRASEMDKHARHRLRHLQSHWASSGRLADRAWSPDRPSDYGTEPLALGLLYQPAS